VSHALANQNIVLPAGDQKIGAIDYFVQTNATPIEIATLNDMPIKQVGGAILTRDRQKPRRIWSRQISSVAIAS